MLTSGGMILTMYTEDKHERVNTQETKRLLFKMVDIQHSNYDENSRRALRTAITTYAEDMDKLARTQDIYSFWLL